MEIERSNRTKNPVLVQNLFVAAALSPDPFLFDFTRLLPVSTSMEVALQPVLLTISISHLVFVYTNFNSSF